MEQARHGWSDQRVEQIMGTLLRSGVILAAVWVLVGGVLFLARHGAGVPNYKVFRSEPADLRHVPGIVKDVLGLERRGIIQLGLLLLIATPVARVAFSVFSFAKQRDRVYVGVTFFVLALLLYGLGGGHL